MTLASLKHKMSTIKSKIISLLVAFGIVLVWMSIRFPASAEKLGEEILRKDSSFLVNVLSNNLSFGVSSYNLLEDKTAIKDTINSILVLQKGQGEEEKAILGLKVYDAKGKYILGMLDHEKSLASDTEEDPTAALLGTEEELETPENALFRKKNIAAISASGAEIHEDRTQRTVISPLTEPSDLTQIIGFSEITFSKRFFLTKVSANRTESFLIGGITLAGLMLLGMMLYLSINRSIVTMNSIMRDIAEGEGDLTKRIKVKNQDELGELANWFNQFLDKLQATVRDISQNTVSLNSSASDLSAISTQMASSSTIMNDQTVEVAKSTDEMSTNINSVAGAAQDATLSVQSVSSAAEEMSANMSQVSERASQVSENTNTIAVALEEMSATINEVTKNTEHAATVSKSAAEKAENTQELMRRLGASANSVGKVVQVIDEIAEKTNLLALNASIEAARAGEAGKGFNVVANEVKDLSKQTAEAIQKIVEQITEMQSNTETSISAIEEITEIINELNSVNLTIAGAVEEQSVTTSEVSQTTIEAASALEEVSQNVAEATRVANEVAGNASSLANNISDISSNAQDTAKGAENVSGNTHDLRTAVNQVNEGSGKVSDRSSELQLLAGTLEQLMSQFKI